MSCFGLLAVPLSPSDDHLLSAETPLSLLEDPGGVAEKGVGHDDCWPRLLPAIVSPDPPPNPLAGSGLR